MTERRPRPEDFDRAGRYYSALIIWLDWRYDDQIDRAKAWQRIERKNSMPVKKQSRKDAPTPLQLAAREQMLETLERAGAGPKALEAEAARIRELIVKEPLTVSEQAEFDALVGARLGRKRTTKAFAARGAEAERKWEKRRGTPWAAKWEALALETAREYDRDLVYPHVDGYGAYYLHKTTGMKFGEAGRKADEKADRKKARRDEKRARREAAATETHVSRAVDAPVAPSAPRKYPDKPANEDVDRPQKKRPRNRVSVEYLDY